MKLLIQDDILNGMDVYVEYTIDTDRPGLMPEEHQIVLLDYGLELTNHTPLQGNRRKVSTMHTSLRGYMESEWMEDKLIDFIMTEETA